MNKHTNKLRKKFNRRTKKKHTNRKNKKNTNIILEQRFKNLNAKTVKALQNKFRKERLLLKNKHIVNREQIGCSSNKNMTGGVAFLTEVIQTIEDVGTNTYNSVYGYPEISNHDPTYQPQLGIS
jgi:hypothetical protein